MAPPNRKDDDGSFVSSDSGASLQPSTRPSRVRRIHRLIVDPRHPRDGRDDAGQRAQRYRRRQRFGRRRSRPGARADEAEQAGRFTVRVYGSADVYTLGYVITAPTGTRFASTDRNWETSDGTSSTVPNGVVLSADGKTLTYGGMTYFPRYTASWTEESYELLSDGTAGDRAVNDGSFRITDGPDSLIGASIAIGYEAK